MIWREIFLEVTLRAFKKTHENHTPWHLNKNQVTKEDIKKLNGGEGVLLALETTVASDISTEFINSMFTNGLITEKKPRYYDIKREVTFKPINKSNCVFKNSIGDKQCSKKVDLVIRRIENDNEKTLEHIPVIIELKRYQLYDFEIGSGNVTVQKPNLSGILRDIENLRSVKKHWAEFENTDYSKYKTCLIYQLVWGDVNTKDVANLKSKLSKELIIPEEQVFLRWFPRTISDNGKPQVEKWIWLALIEIDPDKNDWTKDDTP